MHRTLQFTVTRERYTNYTPADLIQDHAELFPSTNRTERVRGTLYLLNGGRRYVYDHWEIHPWKEGRNRITIYLREVEKGEQA